MGSINNDGRYEIVRFIMEEIGLPKERIEQLLIADNSKFNENHYRELRLDHTKAREAGLVFSDTKDAIHKCLKRFSMI
jgi:dTDP-4-dehydrorhamnose reductase